MKSDLSHLLAFSFLDTQLTFWPFVLLVVVVNALLTHLLLMVLAVVGSQLTLWPFFQQLHQVQYTYVSPLL